MATKLKSLKLQPNRIFANFWFRVRHVWDQIRSIELCAIASVCLWLGITLVVNQPLSSETEKLKERLQHIKSTNTKEGELQQVKAAVSRLKLHTSNTLETFLEFLPSASTQKDQLILLHKLINEDGVIFNRINYQEELLKNLPAKKFMLQLNLEGKESALRIFVHNLLLFPNLGVNNIALDKAINQQDISTMTINISMYYRL